MRSPSLLSVAGLLVAISLSACRPSAVDPSALAVVDSPWVLTWQDEFDGSGVDTTKWGFDLGNDIVDDTGFVLATGWGNNELQCYTRDRRNVFVRDGMLRIRARASSVPECPFTSARLKTRARDGRALFAQRYGRFEFRAKLPRGRGLWPALWMLPQGDHYGSWAASGEIDVMEARGQSPDSIFGTLHYGASAPKNVASGEQFRFPPGEDFTDFHLYAVEWEPGRVRWFIDDVAYQTQTFWWSTSARDDWRGRTPRDSSELHDWPAPFDRPFYLLINLAVGGNFIGNPDLTTRFPGEMQVDFVRVYQRRNGEGPLWPRGPGAYPFPSR